VRALQFLLEGAAVAPARVDEQANITATVTETLRSLADKPVPNHGLFADYARLSAELRGVMTLNAALNQALGRVQQELATATVQANDLRLRVLEAEAQRDAVTSLLSRPDLTDAVTSAARDLVRARTARKG
jgi:hypothetical protein